MSYVQKGYKNRWVEYLQMSLVSLGYSIGPCGIDGHFGGGTENAVIDFQADHNLNQDGKVGNNTWNEIKAEIKPIQEQLIKLGYSVGSCGADGIYGYSTVEAVKNFQKNNGLSVDGIAGPNTQNALFNSSTSLLTNPAFLGIMGKYMFNEQPKQDNTLDLSKIDLGKLAIFMLQKKVMMNFLIFVIKLNQKFSIS
jgi:peptidoglycan hydrolase-like protein with peptidoglycan-binding domain